MTHTHTQSINKAAQPELTKAHYRQSCQHSEGEILWCVCVCVLYSMFVHVYMLLYMCVDRLLCDCVRLPLHTKEW